MAEPQHYQPPTAQEYQSRIFIYEANALIGHRLVQYFRNDHVIEVNPNVIMGTIKNQEKFANQLGLDALIDVNNEVMLNTAIVTADIIIYPLDKNNTRQLQYLLKLLKCSNLNKKIKVICISPVFTWKSINSNTLLKKNDFATRLTLNSTIKQLQNFCLGLNLLNPQVTGCVINTGLVYGMGQDILFSPFKQALQQKQLIKIIGKGNNSIPTIHVDDLAQLTFDIAFAKGEGLHFAVDHGSVTQRQLMEQISQTLGNGKVEEVSIQNGFLHQYFEVLTSDLKVDAKDISQPSVWKYKDGLLKNIGNIVGEFNQSRGLRPNKILIHGSPASGKSKLAEILSKNYGLPVLNIKGLIEEIKAQNSPFANEMKSLLQDLRAAKIEEQRKIYQEIKKKKKGKGVEDFDPTKVVARLGENEVCKIVKRRINMADCLNKGYIIDGVIKTSAQCETVFQDQQGNTIQAILPNSVFAIDGTEEEVKARIKSLPVEATEGTHLNEEQTIRRFGLFKQQNEGKKWSSYFNDKVDIKQVAFNYTDPSQFITFIERNGPLGFKVKATKEQLPPPAEAQQHIEQNNVQQHQEEQEQESDRQQFNLQKLTQNQTKILNQKSRPIRQYLIDNVIPQITEGLLQICKETPPDPINFLIKFLQSKRSKKRRPHKP